MTPYTPEVAMFICKVFTTAIVAFGVFQMSDIIVDWYHYLKG